jgi:site-specific recombinase XerD
MVYMLLPNSTVLTHSGNSHCTNSQQHGGLTPQLPALFLTTPRTAKGFVDFFSANIRNRNTRIAYFKAARGFSDWCQNHGLNDLAQLQTVHVASYIEELQLNHSAPTVRLYLAALRMLFDYLVIQQAIPFNPAHRVRGPKHSIRNGMTKVLNLKETRQLLDSIEVDSMIGRRDRALIGLMILSFARVGAAIKMRVEDYFIEGGKGWVRLHEKGNKTTCLPCHHRLNQLLEEHIGQDASTNNPKSWLFRTAANKNGNTLTERPMCQQDVHTMIRRRAKAAGIKTLVGCHSFRASGITEFLRGGGRLEVAQEMAGHLSPGTTRLYDRRDGKLSHSDIDNIEF